MRLRFTLTEDDYVEAQRTVLEDQALRRWCRRLLWVFAFLGIGAGIGIGCLDYYQERVFNAEAWLVGLPALIVGLFYLLYLTVFWKLFVISDFKKHPTLHGEREWEFDENGIKTSAKIGHTELFWKAIIRWKETPNHFLFFLGKRLFWILPKRAFGDPSEEFALRELLGRKLPQR